MLPIIGMLVIAAQDKPAAPPPDRSAEPMLKAMLAEMGKPGLVGAHVTVESRESGARPFYPARQCSILWYGGSAYQFDFTGYWGDAIRYVRLYETFMIDPLDFTQPVTLKDGDKEIWELDEQLAAAGGWSLVTTYLLGGEKALDKLAPKEASIVAVDPAGPLKGIEVKGSPFGTLTLLVDEKGKQNVVVEARYDNWTSKEKFYKQFPEWVDPPQVGTLDVEHIKFGWSEGRHVRASKMVSVDPPKGMKVDDQRKKKEEGKKPSPPPPPASAR